VAAVAAFLLFNRLGEIRHPIWDEAYNLPTAARFEAGRAQFASHPPLGLMLIAAGDRLSGLNAGVDQRALAAVKAIRSEDMPPGYDYRGPRLASALFGTLGAALFFLLMVELTRSAGAALALSTLYLCDTALLAQFRAAHLDAFQLAFALAAMLCAARMHSARSARSGLGWALGFGCAAACAALVRANGVVLFVMAPFAVWPLLGAREWCAAAVRTLAIGGGAAIALAVVAASYVLLSREPPAAETVAGAQDGRFVSAAHKTALESGDWSVGSVVAASRDYAAYMRADLEAIPRRDPNGSHPLGWLIGKGAILYRWDASSTSFRVLALVPNHAAWLLSLLGVVWTAIRCLRRRDALRLMLLAGWAAAMGVLAWLDHLRVLYVYHYFIPLLIGHALLALAWREARFSQRPAQVGLAAIALSFAAAAPLALHQDTGRWRCELFLPQCP